MIYFVAILVFITVIYLYSIGWVIIGFIGERSKKKNELGEESKKISVIIPVRNEEKSILNCLESLKNQDYNKSNFEIIIINDHSTDKTKEVVDAFISTCELNINLVDLIDETSKKEGLKYGIGKSKYDIIATTDADCTLPKNWLKNVRIFPFSNRH